MSEDTRHARIETRHDDAETAEHVAGALRPDNTAEMTTNVDGDTVVTEIVRDGTGGLQTTVDDYVVNLQVAVQLATQDGATSTQTTDT
jgi:hypothetical protein